MTFVSDTIQALGLTHPATYLALFLAASLLTVWRLNAMMDQGLEGTALGTLVTPYFSGLGNLIFVFLLLGKSTSTAEVAVNALVNNVTNLTLLLGLPALLWGLEIIPSSSGAASASTGKNKAAAKARSSRKNQAADTGRRLNRLSLLLTLTAAIFFAAALWALGQDHRLDFTDGLVLTGIFLFWQCFQVFDVLKYNIRQRVSFGPMFYLDAVIVCACALLLYASLDWLVNWITAQKSGFLSPKNLGWLSGWLMVLPNALLAFYYGARRRADIVYASQIGDGHICIPLAIGLCALVKPVPVPPLFAHAIYFLLAASIVHIGFVALLGRLPRWAGACLVAAYGYFVYAGWTG